MSPIQINNSTTENLTSWVSLINVANFDKADNNNNIALTSGNPNSSVAPEADNHFFDMEKNESRQPETKQRNP